MEFKDVLTGRYSCRAYTKQPVEREKLRACLEAGRIAPSSCNMQRWALVGVDDPALCRVLGKSARAPEELGINKYTEHIPAFIAVVTHPPRRMTPTQRQILRVADREALDIGCAAMQICLQATDLGLGSVMLAWFDREAVGQALGVPQGQQVELLIGLGYPAKEPPLRKSRYAPAEIIRWNGYAKAEKAEPPADHNGALPQTPPRG